MGADPVLDPPTVEFVHEVNSGGEPGNAGAVVGVPFEPAPSSANTGSWSNANGSSTLSQPTVDGASRLALMRAHRATIQRRLHHLQAALTVIDYRITTYGGTDPSDP